jgi:hypothetical protein
MRAILDRAHARKVIVAMGAWTTDELTAIDAADELTIAPRKRDGELRMPVRIWGVCVGPDVYVRAAYGAGTGWHRVARTSREARITAGAVERDVTIEDADASVHDVVDAAYRVKYHRYAGNIVGGITGEEARSTTLRLVPSG